MSPDLGEFHAGPPGRAGELFAAETLAGLQALEVQVIVIGGTAMRVLGSPLPSIDLDCLIPEAAWRRHEVYDFIEARQGRHRTAAADSYLEVEALEWPNRVWNSDAIFRPIDLLAKTGTQLVAGSLAGHRLELELPELDALLFMKTKALTDRAAQLRHALDPVARTALPPHELEAIEGLPAAFFRRKASKDLVDIAFLLGKGAELDALADLAAGLGTNRAMRSGWNQVQADIIQDAQGLLTRHGAQGDLAGAMQQIRSALSG